MMWRSYFYAREIPECRCKQSGRQSALIAPRVISLFHFKVFIIAPIFIQPIIFVFCCCFFCSLMPVTQQWNRGFIWNTPAPVICQIHTKYLQFSSIIHFYGDFSAHNVHVNTDRRKTKQKITKTKNRLLLWLWLYTLYSLVYCLIGNYWCVSSRIHPPIKMNECFIYCCVFSILEASSTQYSHHHTHLCWIS